MTGQQKIIAILGLPGSGKTEVINYLTDKYQLPKIYLPQPIFDEMKKQQLEINEANERFMREELRRLHGNNVLADLAIKRIKTEPTNKPLILIESFYTWDEYLTFKQNFGNNFLTTAIYASPTTRYQRLSQRATRPLTITEAQSRDYSQIENLKQGGPLAIADYTIINEGSLADLQKQTEIIYQKITNS